MTAALAPPRPTSEVADYSLMARLVRAGFGTTLAPASAFSGEILDGLVAVPVSDPKLSWNLSAAVSVERRLSAAASVLLGALTQNSRVPVPEAVLR